MVIVVVIVVVIVCPVVPTVASFPTTPKPWARALSPTTKAKARCGWGSLWAGERGELAVSEPPPLDPAKIEAARKALPWEEEDPPAGETTATTTTSNGACWEMGEVWQNTRVELVNLWVLPRDMSNGAWEAYAVAAGKGEEELLGEVPQLLRLPTERVVASAKTVLTDLNLPPALLRKEPILLSMNPERLLGAFEGLLLDRQQQQRQQQQQQLTETTTTSSSSLETEDGSTLSSQQQLVVVALSTTRKECQDRPGMLANAAMAWERPE